MIKTTWTCDKCKKEQDTPEQMWEVGVTLKSADNRHYATRTETKVTQLWCRECCEVYPFIFPTDKEIPTATAPTFEDFLREIFREEIQDARRD